MTKEKNLNNQEVVKTVGNYIAWKYINKHEEESFEYNITLNLYEEKDGSFTMACVIEENGTDVMSILVGKNYKERGVKIKADQIIKMLMDGDFNRGTCVIKSAGWKKINVEELAESLEEMNQEEEGLTVEQEKIMEALAEEYGELEFDYEEGNDLIFEGCTDDIIQIKVERRDGNTYAIYDRYAGEKHWVYQHNVKIELDEKELIDCHHCQGNGWVEDSYDDMYGNNQSFDHTCEDCNGDGKVDKKEMLEAQRRAEEFVKEYFKEEE